MFRNRTEAGRRLGDQLHDLAAENPVVVGVTRGGVPVAAEVARALGAPLDVVIVRKLGVPRQPEVGFGAIGENGVEVLDEQVMRDGRITEVDLAAIERHERALIKRLADHLHSAGDRLDLTGRTVVVVDDGIAIGTTSMAACEVVRKAGAGRIVLAVPVISPGTVERFAERVDDVVFLVQPDHFVGVGQAYEDFSQVSDDEVLDLLTRS